MAQKTKKSPTPSTAKKTGAELPMDSPKGTPTSLPPDGLSRALAVKVEERHRRALEFEAACSQAFSREGAYREEDPARGEHRFVCLTCGLVTDLEHDDCRAAADRFAGAPTLSAVAEIAKATDQEPEDIVRTFVELGLRVLGRGDRNAYFDARRLWEILNYGGEVM